MNLPTDVGTRPHERTMASELQLCRRQGITTYQSRIYSYVHAGILLFCRHSFASSIQTSTRIAPGSRSMSCNATYSSRLLCVIELGRTFASEKGFKLGQRALRNTVRARTEINETHISDAPGRSESSIVNGSNVRGSNIRAVRMSEHCRTFHVEQDGARCAHIKLESLKAALVEIERDTPSHTTLSKTTFRLRFYVIAQKALRSCAEPAAHNDHC